MGVWRLLEFPPEFTLFVAAFLRFLKNGIQSDHLRKKVVEAAYISDHIWLDQNGCVFDLKHERPRVILRRALIQASEFLWAFTRNFCTFSEAIFYRSPHPPRHLKINFDGSVLEEGIVGGLGFVIKGLSLSFLVAGGCHLYNTISLSFLLNCECHEKELDVRSELFGPVMLFSRRTQALL